MQTVLITGTSSGYGLETARHFLAQGWNVIATMRSPRQGLLPESDRLQLLALDVTDPVSIAAAIDAAGPIDVLVNNAGLGMVGAFEAMPMEKIRAIFETNTFGTMAMCQAAIPGMRAARRGHDHKRDLQRYVGRHALCCRLYRVEDRHLRLHRIAGA